MAIAFVQKKQNLGSSTAVGSFTAQWSTANITTGNVIIVTTFWVGNQGLAATTPVTDSAGNTYTVLGSSLDATNQINTAIAIATITAGGGTKPTVTVTYAGTNAVSFPSIELMEFSGLSTTLDGTFTSAKGSSTTGAPGSIVTTNANDLLYANCIPSNSVTAGPASWTNDIDTNGCCYSYRIISATGTQTPTFTIPSGGPWNTAFVALKMTGGGTTQAGTATIAAGRTVTATPRRNAITTSGIAAGRTVVGTSRVNRPTSSSIAGVSAMVATDKRLAITTVGVAAGRTVVPTSRVNRPGGVSIAGSITALATSKATHFAGVGIASRSTAFPSSFVIGNPVATINGRATILPAGGMNLRGVALLQGISSLLGTASIGGVGIPTPIGARATLAVGPTVLRQGKTTILTGRIPALVCRISGSASIVLVSRVIKRGTVGIFGGLIATNRASILAGVTMLITAKNAGASGRATVGGQSSMFGLPNLVSGGGGGATVPLQTTIQARSGVVPAAWVMHRALCGILAGRGIGPHSIIQTRATVIASASVTAQIASAICNIGTGLKTSVPYQGRIFAKGGVSQASLSLRRGLTATVASRATVGANAVVSKNQAAILATVNLLASSTLVRGTGVGVASQATLTASPRTFTTGPARSDFLTRINLVATGTIKPFYVSAIASRATVTASSRVVRLNTMVLRTTGSMVGTPQTTGSPPIELLSIQALLTNRGSVLYRPPVTMTPGSFMFVIAQRLMFNQATIGSRGGVTAAGSLRGGGVGIFGRSFVIPTGRAIKNSAESIQGRIVLVATGRVQRLTTGLIGARGSILAVGTTLVSTLTGSTIAARASVVANPGRVTRNGALQIRAGATVGSTSRVLKSTSVAIQTAMTLLARSFVQSTIAVHSAITTGATVAATPRVPHSAALNVSAGASIANLGRLLRGGHTDAVVGATVVGSGTALRQGQVALNVRSRLFLGVDEISVGFATIGAGTSMIAAGNAVLRGIAAILAGSRTVATNTTAVHGMTQIAAGLTGVIRGGRAVKASAGIGTHASVTAQGDKNFFGGELSQITTMNPSTEVTTISPSSDIEEL